MQETKNTSKNINKKKISFFLTIIIPIIIYLIPIPNIYGHAKLTLCILAIAAILWITEAIPLHATAFVIVILTNLFGILTPTDALAPFFSPVIALLLGGFVISIAIHKYGLGERASKYMLTHTGTNPKFVLLGLILTTAFLSFWMSNTATTAIMLVSILPIISKIPKGDPFKKAMILGIPFAANAGGIGTPVGTPPNPIAISYLHQIGIEIDFLKWMILTLPLVIVFLLLIWKILLLMYPPTIKNFKAIEMQINNSNGGDNGNGKKKFNKNELFVLGIFLSTVILWLTGTIHGISISIIALMPVVVFLGSNILTHDDFNQVQWEILLLIGGGLTLSNAIQASGLGCLIINKIDVYGLPIPFIILLFTGVGIFMTTFMSNTATAALLIPIIGDVGYQINATAPLVLSIAIGTSMAMALPVSTAPNAIAYGTGEIELKDMIKTGAVISIAALILISTLGFLWFEFIGI